MSVRVDRNLLKAEARLVPPPVQRSCDDHSFELPAGIYAAMAALLFGFLIVLAIGLANPNLVVPMGINFAFLTAFFAIPAIFVGAAHDGKSSRTWSQFMARGVQTEAGHASGREAAILVLMLPAFIFCWALAIVAINAAI